MEHQQGPTLALILDIGLDAIRQDGPADLRIGGLTRRFRISGLFHRFAATSVSPTVLAPRTNHQSVVPRRGWRTSSGPHASTLLCIRPMTSRTQSEVGVTRHASTTPLLSSFSETCARLMAPVPLQVPSRTLTLQIPQPPLRHPMGIPRRPSLAIPRNKLSSSRHG